MNRTNENTREVWFTGGRVTVSNSIYNLQSVLNNCTSIVEVSVELWILSNKSKQA